MTMLRKEEFMSSELYELKELDTFTRNIRKFFKKDEARIREKLKQNLETIPNRFQMLSGQITVAGMKLVGLRHIKVGAEGYRGGSVTRFRISEECLREKYHVKSKVRCQFCNEKKPRTVVLFYIQPRGFGYR